MISILNVPNTNKNALLTPSVIDICIDAMFNVPNGREPRKLTSIPVKKIRIKGRIQQM
jgi:hypothetical protein